MRPEDTERRSAFIRLAVTGLTLLALSDVAPMMMDPEVAPVGISGALLRDGAAATVRHIPWLRIAVTASVIPLAVDLVHGFFRQIPRKVVQHATRADAVSDVPDPAGARVAEDTDWPGTVRAAGVPRPRRGAAYQDRGFDWDGEIIDDADRAVLLLPAATDV
ncbi:hypothetical protein GCM10025857_14570 [Alicyclobacillus contaminans]|uniref:hypothetical protein n=1 Tax=Alicyclobacillus contaminans TaxID=392016 RepID=UPI001FE1662D|nr:hypothetical protein [Alicyclobacillus contaminans]GMA50100.1 hypothetical protein GCM10025857_14570 [Alicyclobacillus contaminans]